MKTATLIAVIAFVATHATAVPQVEPEARGRLGDHGVNHEETAACGVPGRPCNAIKHAAHGIANILNEADKQGSTHAPYCRIEGQPCHAAQPHIVRIAEKARAAYSTVYAREANAIAEAAPKFYARHHGWLGHCGVPGEFCMKKRDGETHFEHIGCEPGKFCPHGHPEYDPEGHAALRGRLGVIGESGTPGLVSRDAAPKKFYAPHYGWLGHCGAPGEFCMKKRDFEGICGADGHECVVGREALEQVRKDPSKKAELKGCGPYGTPCLVTRNAAPEPKFYAHHYGWLGHCGVPGEFCMKKRNAEPAPFCPPGAPCLSGRDAQAFAGMLNANDPDFTKKECNKPGNECHTIKEIKKHFDGLKKQGFAPVNWTTIDAKEHMSRCTERDGKCSILSIKHEHDKHHGKPEAAKGEAACQSQDGYCGAAKRDLDELESAINEAIASIEE